MKTLEGICFVCGAVCAVEVDHAASTICVLHPAPLCEAFAVFRDKAWLVSARATTPKTNPAEMPS